MLKIHESLFNTKVTIILNERFHTVGILRSYQDGNYAIEVGHELEICFEEKAVMKVDSLNKEIYINEVI